MSVVFFFNDTATTEIYTLSLHDALPISGFNSLQLACERPPALKAVCAIYATDDRWTDDVHYRGGALKLVDLVDYNHYMTPMCALPPVPAVYGPGWREEWRRRLETMEPWVLTWMPGSMGGERSGESGVG